MSAGRKSVRIILPHPALSISRFDLDLALWNRALNEGVTCVSGVRVHSASEDSVSTSVGVVEAGTVVNATGRWSELGVKAQPIAKRIGIKAHFRGTMPHSSVCEVRFFKHGYVGVQPIGDGILNVSALVDARECRTMQSVLHAAGIAAEDWTPVTPTITCPPVRFHKPQPVRDGILQCGDAAGFIDPFTGDGMSLAVYSGALAARHAGSREGIREYADAYNKRFTKTFRTASLLRHFVFGPEWLRSTGISLMHLPGFARLAFAETRAA